MGTQILDWTSRPSGFSSIDTDDFVQYYSFCEQAKLDPFSKETLQRILQIINSKEK